MIQQCKRRLMLLLVNIFDKEETSGKRIPSPRAENVSWAP
jgi:hypothetical protein